MDEIAQYIDDMKGDHTANRGEGYSKDELCSSIKQMIDEKIEQEEADDMKNQDDYNEIKNSFESNDHYVGKLGDNGLPIPFPVVHKIKEEAYNTVKNIQKIESAISILSEVLGDELYGFDESHLKRFNKCYEELNNIFSAIDDFVIVEE